jgi:hypothetical protein
MKVVITDDQGMVLDQVNVEDVLKDYGYEVTKNRIDIALTDERFHRIFAQEVFDSVTFELSRMKRRMEGVA